MRGKEVLKRVFYGPLKPVPARVGPETASVADLIPVVTGSPMPAFKVFYAIGQV